MTKSFEIYKNYGVLAAEKRSIYTYKAEAATATCSDKITVELPGNPYFELYTSVLDELLVETSWGAHYTIDEVLEGNARPAFAARSHADNEVHRVELIVIE